MNFLQRTSSNTLPLLLLDDIFDKLDAQRVEAIVKLVAGDHFGQIFITDHGIFAPPRSFSQLITSFIGSQCQGIHPALLMLDLYSWSAAIIALMTGFCVLCFKSN